MDTIPLNEFKRDLFKQSRFNQYPNVRFIIKRLTTSAEQMQTYNMNLLIGICCTVRKKHSDGKFYMTSFCDYNMCNEFNDHSESLTQLTSRFNIYVSKFIESGIIDTNMRNLHVVEIISPSKQADSPSS